MQASFANAIFQDKRALIALVAALVAIASMVSFAALTAANAQSSHASDQLVANIQLPHAVTITQYGVSVTFDSIQLYNSHVTLSEGSNVVLTATKQGSQSLDMNVNPGPTTVVKLSDPDGIIVQTGGVSVTVHTITVTATFSNGQLTSVNWQAS